MEPISYCIRVYLINTGFTIVGEVLFGKDHPDNFYQMITTQNKDKGIQEMRQWVKDRLPDLKLEPDIKP